MPSWVQKCQSKIWIFELKEQGISSIDDFKNESSSAVTLMKI